MLCLTRIKRSYVIDHVMPSDLDDKDIKHGLFLKEKMIQEITDDYIKEHFPNWKELERSYRKNGIYDICDKLMCGEMTSDDIIKPKTIETDVWLRWKLFTIGDIIEKDYGEDFIGRYETYDFDRLDGYGDWVKSNENYIFSLSNVSDIMVQFMLVIKGDNAKRYYPYQDMNHYSGFQFVPNELKIYDPQVWSRDYHTGKIIGSISNQEEYYRFFFKDYMGYYEYDDFFKEDNSWINQNYPNIEIRTLRTDPIRILYDVNSDIKFSTINARQWIKINYKTVYENLTSFKLNINNRL